MKIDPGWFKALGLPPKSDDVPLKWMYMDAPSQQQPGQLYAKKYA